jgi:hypothetical protein
MRESRVFDDNQVNDIMDELKYEDPEIDQEMRDYIKDLISCMTTGDEK